MSLAQIGEREIQAVAARWKKEHTEQTLYGYTLQLRAFCRFAETSGRARGIAGCVPRARFPRVRAVTATDEEIQTILDAAPLGIRLLVLLCLDSAMRYSEAIQVGPHNFNPEKKIATVRIKGGDIAQIPVTERAAAICVAAAQVTAHGQSFVKALEGHTSDAAPRAAWSRLKHKLGIRGELHIHDLRRTTATRAYHATKNLATVQAILNHSDMRSTLRYIAPTAGPEIRLLLEALRIPSTRPIQ
jgi:integrase